MAAEKPARGFGIAARGSPGSALGAVWRVVKPQVCRSLERLTALGLVREVGREPSRAGPVRQLCEVTLAGRQLARAWLGRPGWHGRDVRSELMVKLAPLDRAGQMSGAMRFLDALGA